MTDKTDNSPEMFEKIGEFINSGQEFAVATVVKAEGSTPRKAGVRAIISKTGKIYGTLGGGAVEAKTQCIAIESCKSRKPVVFNFQLHGANRDDENPICGGTMRILIDPTIFKYKRLFENITESIQSRRKGVLLSIFSETSELRTDYQWLPEDSIRPDIASPGYEKIGYSLNSEIPQLFSERSKNPHETKEIFVEPLIPKPLLVIAGGGHIGQALARQASLVGFDIMIFDDRLEFTNKELFPKDVKTRTGKISKLLNEIRSETGTYVVIVTRGHQHDAEALEICIKKTFTYVGMIGSKRKVHLIRENFIQSGLSNQEEFDRVFSPIGIDIGAVTVPEIATSITAELIAVRRKGIVHKPLQKVGAS